MNSISNMKCVIGLAFAVGLCSATVEAGEFNAWTYAKSAGQQDVVVSFASDGVDQEAMVDFYMPKGAKLIKSEVLVAGSVCVGLDNDSYLRVVPPSGAGTALPAKETDYCRFTIQMDKAKRSSQIALKSKFTECSAPLGEIKSCGLSVYDVSEKVGR